MVELLERTKDVSVLIGDLDIGAVQADAQAKLEALAEQAARLTPEALGGDQDAIRELDDIESERQSAERMLERADAAVRELQRRSDQAAADAKAERLEAARVRSGELELERRKLAAKADKSAKAFAEAVAEWYRVTLEQKSAVVEAGWSSGNSLAVVPRAFTIENCLRHWLRVAGVPDKLLRFDVPRLGGGVVGPLAALDARVVPTAEGER
jgi:beta-glucosidase-like glycosyl hydrolase